MTGTIDRKEAALNEPGPSLAADSIHQKAL